MKHPHQAEGFFVGLMAAVRLLAQQAADAHPDGTAKMEEMRDSAQILLLDWLEDQISNPMSDTSDEWIRATQDYAAVVLDRVFSPLPWTPPIDLVNDESIR